MSTNHGPFGPWLEGQLDARDWKKADLARRIGVEGSVVSRWVIGKAIPTPEMCQRIAAALGYADEYVMYRAGHLPRLPASPAQYERAAWATWLARMDARYEDVEVADERRITINVYGYIPADELRLVEPMVGIEPVRVLPEQIAGARSPFALIASGDCMSSVGIVTGTYVILDRPDGRVPSNDQIVAVRVNQDEVTLKRWIVTSTGIELHDGNGTCVYRVSPMDDVEVIGLYVWHCPPLPKGH